MNHRNVRKTVNPGVCAKCAHSDVYDTLRGKPRHFCWERPIKGGRTPCEKFKERSDEK